MLGYNPPARCPSTLIFFNVDRPRNRAISARRRCVRGIIEWPPLLLKVLKRLIARGRRPRVCCAQQKALHAFISFRAGMED